MKPQASYPAWFPSLSSRDRSCGSFHFLPLGARGVSVSHSGLSASEHQQIKMVALLEGSISTSSNSRGGSVTRGLSSHLRLVSFFFFPGKTLNILKKLCSPPVRPPASKLVSIWDTQDSPFIFNVFQRWTVPNHPEGVFKFQSPWQPSSSWCLRKVSGCN